MAETTIITAGSRSYRHWVKPLVSRAQEFGHEIIVYDLGGLDIGKPFQVPKIKEGEGFRPRSPFKPLLIHRAMMHYGPERTQTQWVWMDGDTELLAPIPTFRKKFDFGVTIHKADEEDRRRGYRGEWSLNAGVVFINATKAAEGLLFDWMDFVASAPTGSDQDALVDLLKSDSDVWSHPQASLRLFDGSIFNNRKESAPGVIVRHYAEGGKSRDL